MTKHCGSRGLGVMGVGALFEQAGIDHAKVLERITAYDMSRDRDKAADSQRLVNKPLPKS